MATDLTQEEKYKEMLESLQWIAKDSFCHEDDAVAMQEEARQTLIKIGETWKGVY